MLVEQISGRDGKGIVMIGRLSGRIEYRSDDHVLLDVRGVGYLIYCSERTLRSLPSAGEYTALYTDLLVREDILQLFGFTSIVEKEWHRLLMTVQGVGAKAALAIMGALGSDGLSRAISIGDWAAVKQAKGIGPKTAQRVIIELKEKAPQVIAMAANLAYSVSNSKNSGPDNHSENASLEPEIETVSTNSLTGPSVEERQKNQAEALSALKNLGYSPSEAANAIALANDLEDTSSTPEIIKKALRLLSPKEN